MHRSGDPPSYLLNPPLTFHISAIPVLLILNRPRSSSHSGHDSALIREEKAPPVLIVLFFRSVNQSSSRMSSL